MNLGETIATLRKEKGITQEELAERVGVSRQAVTKWESNESIPELPKLCGLADVLEVSLDKLVGRQENAIDMVLRKLDEYYEPETPLQAGDEELKAVYKRVLNVLPKHGLSAAQVVEVLQEIISDGE